MNAPKGCVFHTRCPYCMPVCKEKKPQMHQIMPNHCVACHMFQK